MIQSCLTAQIIDAMMMPSFAMMGSTPSNL